MIILGDLTNGSMIGQLTVFWFFWVNAQLPPQGIFLIDGVTIPYMSSWLLLAPTDNGVNWIAN